MGARQSGPIPTGVRRHPGMLTTAQEVDDIQGTAAVAVAAVIRGMRLTRAALTALRLVIVGANAAGTCIARQAVAALVAAGVAEDEAIRRCWLIDRDGLLHSRLTGLRDRQRPFAHPWEDVAHLADSDDHIGLLAVVNAVGPHALIGVSGQAGVFTEEVVRAVAVSVCHPIIMPMSKPKLRPEATPVDLIAWTDGRAIVGTGRLSPPVLFRDSLHPIAFVNHMFMFQGLGQGVTSVNANRVSDAMLAAAATAIGTFGDSGESWNSTLLPALSRFIEVTDAVAFAVARQAVHEGSADYLDDDQINAALDDNRRTAECPPPPNPVRVATDAR